jgi:hypothetical protein
LYELPKPQPIVEEAPVVPNIPFVQRLPITKEFKKNTNKDTFTIDEAWSPAAIIEYLHPQRALLETISHY